MSSYRWHPPAVASTWHVSAEYSPECLKNSIGYTPSVVAWLSLVTVPRRCPIQLLSSFLAGREWCRTSSLCTNSGIVNYKGMNGLGVVILAERPPADKAEKSRLPAPSSSWDPPSLLFSREQYPAGGNCFYSRESSKICCINWDLYKFNKACFFPTYSYRPHDSGQLSN